MCLTASIVILVYRFENNKTYRDANTRTVMRLLCAKDHNRRYVRSTGYNMCLT